MKIINISLYNFNEMTKIDNSLVFLAYFDA